MKDIPYRFTLNDKNNNPRNLQVAVKIEDQEHNRTFIIAKEEFSLPEKNQLFAFECCIENEEYLFKPIYDEDVAETLWMALQEAGSKF